MDNPLIMATDARDCLSDMEGDMMFAIGGEAAFEPFDSELCDAVIDLVYSASESVTKLSPRARQARLNLIWRDFQVSYAQKMADRRLSAAQAVSNNSEKI
jgi:hypothetical protein